MLLASQSGGIEDWTTESLATLIRVYRACLDFRRSHLDVADDVGSVAAGLIAAAGDGRLLAEWTSSATVHTSAVDDEGLGCSITASAGYGSGEMPEGTGLWLNNGLGEVELNRRDVATREPGSRLPSNMAPSVARSGDAVLAIGSPGADRITTAIHQALTNFLRLGMSLHEAIAFPRLHVDTTGEVGSTPRGTRPGSSGPRYTDAGVSGSQHVFRRRRRGAVRSQLGIRRRRGSAARKRCFRQRRLRDRENGVR